MKKPSWVKQKTIWRDLVKPFQQKQTTDAMSNGPSTMLHEVLRGLWLFGVFPARAGLFMYQHQG